jgi:hypothetical protein
MWRISDGSPFKVYRTILVGGKKMRRHIVQEHWNNNSFLQLCKLYTTFALFIFQSQNLLARSCIFVEISCSEAQE